MPDSRIGITSFQNRSFYSRCIGRCGGSDDVIGPPCLAATIILSILRIAGFFGLDTGLVEPVAEVICHRCGALAAVIAIYLLDESAQLLVIGCVAAASLHWCVLLVIAHIFYATSTEM
jgi:hypothetical protein